MMLRSPLPLPLPDPPPQALDWLGRIAIGFMAALVVCVWGFAIAGIVATAGWW